MSQRNQRNHPHSVLVPPLLCTCMPEPGSELAYTASTFLFPAPGPYLAPAHRQQAVSKRSAHGPNISIPSTQPHQGPFTRFLMAIKSISFGSLHVRASTCGGHRTCGEPNQIKQSINPGVAALFSVFRCTCLAPLVSRRYQKDRKPLM